MAHKIVKIFDKRMGNDIRYRGPLSYRHLMILGWISMAFKLLSIILSIGDSLDLPESQSMQTLEAIANFSGNFALPLFLFANFAIILDRKNSYKRQLLWFGGLSALIVFLFILFKEHYIVGIISALLGDREAAEELIDEILYSLSLKGSLVFNLFIDLFMCTLLMFFLNYVPKRFFTGGKKKLFRLFALVPILYETGSLIIRIVMAYGVTTPNYLIYPFLTTKPFMSFVLFLILVLHLKFQERRLRKNGIGLEEYQAYTRTNAHSLRFSVYATVMILITAVIDFILYVIVSLAVLLPSMMESEIVSEEALAEIQISAGRIRCSFPDSHLVPNGCIS